MHLPQRWAPRIGGAQPVRLQSMEGGLIPPSGAKWSGLAQRGFLRGGLVQRQRSRVIATRDVPRAWCNQALRGANDRGRAVLHSARWQQGGGADEAMLR